MKKLCVFYLAIFGFSTLWSQKISLEFGNISQYEIDYEYCEFDSTAEAVVFFDIGQSAFIRSESGFNISFQRKKRLKILTDAGLDFAQVEIPFYHNNRNYEKVSRIKAASYNYEDNVPRITELAKGDWHIEKVNEHWDVLKFAIPDVKAGSVLEYSYELVTPFQFQLPDWEFQDRIPIIYSAYEVRMIPFYEYTSLLKGTSTFDHSKSYEASGMERSFAGVAYSDMVYEFAMHNVPSFKDETLISSKNDYLIQLDFQLAKIKYPSGQVTEIISSWPKIIEELEDKPEFGKFVKKSKKIADDEIDLTLFLNQPEKDRFNRVMDHVKQNYNCNVRYGQAATKTVKDLVNDKYGSAAELNLFATGLLRANNIEAYPVWISTRGHGKIPYDYPFTHFFDYVLIYAKVDGKTILTDATEVFLPNDRIPMRCINDLGLVINEDADEVKWVKLDRDFPSKEYIQYKLKLDSNAVSAEINKMTTEYDAWLCRNNFGENEDKFKEALTKDGYSYAESSLETKSFMEPDKPYIVSYQVKSDAVRLNDKIYISPFLNDVISDNPLKQKVRTYPVDFTIPKIRSYVSRVPIPKRYEVSYIPKNYEMSNDLVDIKYTSSVNEGYLVFQFEYYFKKAIYFAEDYEKIKDYFNQIISKGNDKVVFSKIKVDGNS